MESQAEIDGEVRKVQDKFRIDMLKAARRTEELLDPQKLEELANIPPHLLNKR